MQRNWLKGYLEGIIASVLAAASGFNLKRIQEQRTKF